MATNELEPVPTNAEQSASRSQSNLQSNVSYAWTTNNSIMSSDVDHWIGGDSRSPVPPGITAQQPMGSMPRATLANSNMTQMPPLPTSGFWYVAALVLPLISASGTRHWRCSPSAILNTAEVFLTQVAGYCNRARSRVRRMAHEQVARDVFAGAMDVILVLYAIGFLLISLYQASVFQQPFH